MGLAPLLRRQLRRLLLNSLGLVSLTIHLLQAPIPIGKFCFLLQLIRLLTVLKLCNCDLVEDYEAPGDRQPDTCPTAIEDDPFPSIDDKLGY